MEEQEKNLQSQIMEALQDETLPVIYFNGFVNTIGSGDVLIILKRHEKPVAVLNVSYSVAKSMATKLGGIIASFEQKIGNVIMTTDEINQKIKEGQPNDVDE